jgi:hypothetical protein
MTSATLRLVACATALHLLSASTSAAQRISISDVFANTSQDLLKSPTGPMLTLTTPIARHVDLSLTVSRLQGTEHGNAVVCGGLINPDRCPVEPFAQTGRLSVVGIGADWRLVTTRAVEVSLKPQFLWGRARSETLGGLTGNRLFSDEGQLGFSGGLELRAFPVQRFPVGVVAGGAVGRLGPTHLDNLIDGYSPFNQWFTATTLYVGGVFRFRSRR